MDSPLVMGIDVSLQRTGVSFVGMNDDGTAQVETRSFGRKGKRDEPLRMRRERLITLRDEVRGSLGDHMEWPLLVCIEDVAFGTPGGSTTDRAALWWFIVDAMLGEGIPVLQINVSKLKIYATGRGNKHEKDEVAMALVRRYTEAPIANNDEADATGLAMMGARLLGKPYEKSMPQTHLRALDGLELPTS
jgi:Holliday junction resolvasome RuvABC endonuclease subunit